jgi:phospholipid/cholesterol/gamma-HCH transport system substrate-binding protein
MPRTRSLALSELRIGALTVTALIIGATAIFMLSSQSGFFWQRYHLKARFPEVPGLAVGAPVRVAGIESGTVTAITYVGSGVDVEFELSRKLEPEITTGAVASLGSLSLLGQSTVDIRPSATGQPIPEWGYVRSGRSSGQFGSVTASATESLDQLTKLLEGVRRGQGTVGRLFTDEQLYQEIQAMVSASEAVVASVRAGRGTVGKLVNDPSVYDDLNGALTRLNALLARIDAGEGSLGQFVKDDRLARSLTSATDNLDTVVQKLNKGEGTAGKLLTDAGLYDRINSLAERLDRLVARLDQGQGTAGQLLQDRQLYENMNGAASELRALLAEVRKDPKKYLNMKLSLF